MTTKIAISLPDHLVEQARRAVQEGEAASVSAYIAAALEAKSPPIGLRALLEQWDEELGPPSAEAKAWARAELDRVDAESASNRRSRSGGS